MAGTQTMTYTLEQVAADIRAALTADPGPTGKAKVGRLLSRVLTDPQFAARHLKDRAKGGDPREVLYEDPELGFCILGHVHHDQPAAAVSGDAAGQLEGPERGLRVVGRMQNRPWREAAETSIRETGRPRQIDSLTRL